MTPVPLAVAESLYRFLYERRRRRFARPPLELAELPCKVVSVGNITVGGTGKTPAVQWIGRMLQARGLAVGVVARGYRGEMSSRGAVVSDGSSILLDAGQAGDEPLLHARALPGAIVVVGRDREAGVRRAHELGAQIVVLDDGFQYWSLRRNFDLVLLDAVRPFDNGRLLPAGRLREPPETLLRASAVLLTRTETASEEQLKATHEQVKKYTAAPIFESSHRAVALRDERSGEQQPLSGIDGVSVAALSAIANNEGFLRSLQAHGAQVVHSVARGDHHAWKAWELQRLASESVRRGAKAIVTTEKDAVKIDPAWAGELPLWSLAIELAIREGKRMQELILTSIGLADDSGEAPT